MSVYHCFAMAQHQFAQSERLIRAISGWTFNQRDTVETVLAEGVDVNRVHGTLLPLHCACMAGDVDYVKLILDHGAEVNGVDGYGRTAIQYAAEQDAECVGLLLEYGADPNARNTNNETAVHWAAFRNKPDCLRLLLSDGNAASNPVDIHGNTPLSWAAMKGHYDSVRLLLEYGAEVHTASHDGVTPIARVAGLVAAGLETETEAQCLELLICASGQFDVRDEEGDFTTSVASDTELCAMLTRYCCQPRSLRQQCRYSVRHLLNDTHLPDSVMKLPLPSSILRYLLLQT